MSSYFPKFDTISSSRSLRLLAIGLVLLLIRIPFFLTHYIQEDAFISWRCALNLKATGVYGFNVDEWVSASTSHLYVFVLTLVDILFGNLFIPATLLMNALVLLAGLYLLSQLFFENGSQEQEFLWVLLSLYTISISVTNSGMETSLLIFLVGVTFSVLREKRSWSVWLAFALLPWVRPDAILFNSIAVLAMLHRDRRISYPAVLASIVGGLSLSVFNYFIFGNVINQTIIAKSVAYRMSYSPGEVLERVYEVFTHKGGIFSPIQTSYLNRIGLLVLLISIAATLLYFWQNRWNRERAARVVAIGLVIFLIPVVFAAGAGHTFPWYFWTSGILNAAVVLTLAIERLTGFQTRPLDLVRQVVLIFSVSVFLVPHWFILLNWGAHEQYRTAVGKFLGQISQPKDRILLEPAGYIPFYSGRYTYDEIGLVSPVITAYRRKYGEKYWIRFVEDYKPEYLVLREQVLDSNSYSGYRFSSTEVEWMRTHYGLVRTFEYQPEDFYENPFLVKVLHRGGSPGRYHIFELR